jgi:hypothetical protein
VVATSGAVAPEIEGQIAPSIGRPITNATALILDGALRAVPPGEPGELRLPGRSSAAGTATIPSSRQAASSPWRQATGPMRGPCGCTARVTRSGCWRTARSPSSAGWTSRSRSGVPDRARRDRRHHRPVPRCRGERCRRAPHVRRRPGRPCRPRRARARGVRRDRDGAAAPSAPTCAPSWRHGCPSTWSRPGSWASTPCR